MPWKPVTANTGNASARPGQDGRFGRDPAAGNPGASGFSKPAGSGGSGGFAFTPLEANGTAIALTGSPPVPSATPRCIWDRVTNLIWEVKTNDGGLQDQNHTYGWGANNTGTCTGGSGCSTDAYINDLNNVAGGVCPVTGAGVWRLPTVQELLSIVNFGSSSPAIDVNYLPNTMSASYRSAETGSLVLPPPPINPPPPPPPPLAVNGVVRFDSGVGLFVGFHNDHVRLVRDGP